MNSEDFVTYEQALALKKLRFREDCLYYYKSGEIYPNCGGLSAIIVDDYYDVHNYKSDVTLCDAPTLAQAQKWLREVKELIICVEPRFYRGRRPLVGYSFHINEKENRPFTYIESEAPSNTYEEALSAGITECIKILEKSI